MSNGTGHDESFRNFINSFSYASRTDLNFKFLAELSTERAAQFLQNLLWKLGDTINDGDVERIIGHIRDGQRQVYSEETRWTYDTGPFTPLKMPLSETRVALLTSSGHFVKNADPEPFGTKDMIQEEVIARIDECLKNEPTLSSIPAPTLKEDLCVRHPGYDIRGAQSDPNVAFPLERLRELHQEGMIGELAPNAYSFVGACSQVRLLKYSGPQWVAMFQQQHIDAALLIPV